MRRIILAALVTTAFASGCAGTVGYSGTVTATTPAPELVYASPGVQVIADFDQPVFYADNFYWRYDNGYWYRSDWYTGGWVYATPPRVVLSINQPWTYRHYRPHGYVSRRTYVRGYDRAPAYRGESRTYVRDHRAAPVRSHVRSAPVRARVHTDGPRVRDHR